MSNRVTLKVESDDRGVFETSLVAGDTVNTDPLFLKTIVEKCWVRLGEEMYTEEAVEEYERKRDGFTEREAADKLRDLGFEIIPVPEEDRRFTVYSAMSVESFPSEADAKAWADQQHGLNGGTYECRDADFNHVFTVED